MKRLLVASLLLVTSLPAVALAAPDTVEVKLGGVQADAVVEGALRLTATASAVTGIRRIEIRIADRLVEAFEPSEIKQNVDVSYNWATTTEPGTTQPSANGEYQITARAFANGDENATDSLRILVDNPPVTPTGVSIWTTDQGVELAWDANPEPDLVGYRVERSGGGDYEVLGQTTEPSFHDAVGAGSYSYRISAIRSSAVSSSGRSSAPSPDVSITIEPAVARALRTPDGRRASARSSNGFTVRGGDIAPRGLPSGASLPGQAGLPEIPGATTSWGTYDPKLPYEMPKGGGIPLEAVPSAEKTASWTVIPPDGLRWVAAGALLIALAALALLSAKRLEVAQASARPLAAAIGISATPLPKH